MRTPLLSLAAAVGLALSLSGGAAAQTVVGSVVEEGTLRPIAGAFVVLQDAAGRRAAGGLAGEEGRFALQAPGPGEYRLVARFIGYADATTTFFALGAGETVRRTIPVSVRAVTLEGIRAEVGSRCRPRPGSGPRTARLWEEAGKALEIIDWTEAEAALRFRIVEHVRELDVRTLRVSSIREQGRSGWYSESPYRSVPAEELISEGYIRPAPDGNWDHFAPDAEVLLSDSFLETHCFRVADSRDPELVGLAFEPVPARTLPDVEGVLWLDRGTAELRRVDFTYVNIPYPHGAWDQVGGRVEFERLATGLWVVRRWGIRMPLEARWTGGFGGQGRELVLESLTEEGAEVVEVRTGAGELLAAATGATLYGAVRDSLTGRPLAGARVELLPTGLATTTGTDGAYRLSGLPTGTFGVRIHHAHLELLGSEPLRREVRLEGGRATRLTVTPSLTALALARCAETAGLTDPIVIYGHVRDPADGTAVAGAVVRVLAGATETRTVSDSAGGYAVCVERGDPPAVAAVGGVDVFRAARLLPLADVEIGSGVLAHRDLTLERAALTNGVKEGVAHRGSVWSNTIIGTVLRHDDGAPVPGATVVARYVDGRPIHASATDEHGRFVFTHPDWTTEEFELTVEHVGYQGVSSIVEFGPGEQLKLEVVLTERAIDLDPIVVTERRRGFLADMGFYDRVDQGAGLFIQREEIERRVPTRLTDLMRGRGGWRLTRTPGGEFDIRITGTTRLLGDCQPAIWMDGVLVRAAGEPRVATSASGARLYLEPQLSELVTPEEVEAMEVYDRPAGTPMQYGGSGAACGVVLIWTRRGGG